MRFVVRCKLFLGLASVLIGAAVAVASSVPRVLMVLSIVP